MQQLQNKFKYVRDKIEGKIDHPFLSQYIQEPYIDEDKLLLLISIFDQLDLPLEKWENYALTTMLLEVALDTHEKVTNCVMNKSNQKNIQLTVLAGTYFSGLYYKILSDQKDIQMIKILAEGIEIINDQKILLYHKDLDAIDRLMQGIVHIESSLIKKISAYFEAKDWDDLISHFLFIKRVTKEKERFQKEHSSVLFDALKKIIFPKGEFSLEELSVDQKNYLIHICDRYIDFSKKLLLNAMDKISYVNTVLEERILSVINEHQAVANSLAEEG